MISTKSSSELKIDFQLNNDLVGFKIEGEYDRRQTLIIDPFVSLTDNLTGRNSSKAKDVDFDYKGNVFVAGGGDFMTVSMLAKYNSQGTLLWTFSGTLLDLFPDDDPDNNTDWSFGPNYGGWTVDKISGKPYLSQGLGSYDYFGNSFGPRVIRLDESGMYDNYISDQNPQFREHWKLLWINNNGSPKIFIGGGGTNSPLNFGVFSPSSPIVTVTDITWGNEFQSDIADLVIDTLTRDLYCVFGGFEPHIFKVKAPYKPINHVWNSLPSPLVLKESFNRPYMEDSLLNSSEHSVNFFALNTHYLYSWDGQNLIVYNRSNGTPVGTPFKIESNTPKMQGGIYADECNNVFIGNTNGTIKVLYFDGSVFNDTIQPDISIPGFSTSSVYDIATDPNTKTIYASGNGFVSAIDISAYGPAASFSVQAKMNCSDNSVSAVLNPLPPSGSVVTYSLMNSSTMVSSNTTGIFSSLDPSISYHIKITISQVCGSFSSPNFTAGGPVLALAKKDVCINTLGEITATGSSGVAPYSFSIDGISFQLANTFTGLNAGSYTVTIKDYNGCAKVRAINIGTCLSASATTIDANCSNNDGSLSVTAINGYAPYLYSIDGINFQTNHQFFGLKAGAYNVIVKDSENVSFTIPVTIGSANNLKLITTSTPSQCVSPNGSIVAEGLGGIEPYLYSIDLVNYQSSGNFSNVIAGNYVLSVKDASGCITQDSITIQPINNLWVNAGTDATICEGENTDLNSTTNGDNFSWSPSTGLNNPTSLNPTANPSSTTKYFITTSAGPCISIDSITIIVHPTPVANAGKDTIICKGQSLQLSGSGGISYNWAPPNFLDNPVIANPTVNKPASTINYYLKVIDNNNCTSLKSDTVQIVVSNSLKIFAGRDTSVQVNTSLQLSANELNGNSNLSYTWNPPTGLNNQFISNPIAWVNSDIIYSVTGYTQTGCEAMDTIIIKVYLNADIFVPTAFTPNQDGKNDLLKAIPMGIKTFKFFKIFNRWGEEVFFTSDPLTGWNGIINGKTQQTGVFTWMARGIDFKGNLVERKGTTLLLQ